MGIHTVQIEYENLIWVFYFCIEEITVFQIQLTLQLIGVLRFHLKLINFDIVNLNFWAFNTSVTINKLNSLDSLLFGMYNFLQFTWGHYTRAVGYTGRLFFHFYPRDVGNKIELFDFN